MITKKFPKSSAVILGGGKAVRMGRPKQMIEIAGTAMLFRSVKTFLETARFDELVIVTDPKIQSECKAKFRSEKIKYAKAGTTRLKSVINGVNKTDKKTRLIAVHDGARPLVSKKVILECLKKANLKGASVAAVRCKDTIKSSKDGKTIDTTLNRNNLWQAQTPQCYKTEFIKKALKKFSKNKNATDESQLVEKLGIKTALVKSDYKNIKITTPEDLTAANAFCAQISPQNMRIGFGYDLHRMVSGRPFIAGGITIPHSKGLLGHSDGDVVLHAVCDAALSAVCAGEIGVFFPPTDLAIMGISSRVIAEKTMQILKSKKAHLLHIDVTIVAEEPKIFPYYYKLRRSLAAIFKLPIESVSVKAKSQEGVGEIGKGKAVACHALATVRYE
jgi:2-C-methyl-D-erythritol 4-phosphate cytidylyltransferase/2-C-methyl-D-erythritol 2,4-cyclodiphosphate synthase